ncbi:MAG: right-handed parallel beta-helix repeat-containing protein, partial [Betaproteobacteria bacterium]
MAENRPFNLLRCLKPAAWIAVLFLAGAGALFLLAVENFGVLPRTLASYVERRASGHNPSIVNLGHVIGKVLTALDRGSDQDHGRSSLSLGFRYPDAAGSSTALRSEKIVFAASREDLLKAILEARPGDVITLRPGSYRFTGAYIDVNRSGTPAAGIMLRAELPGTVFLEFDMEEGFLVSAAYWSFENLTIRGVCRRHPDCEHAFHVVTAATHFTARNNTILDFNAHFKINGSGRLAPDYGLIEGNTLRNTSVRRTDNPVALIDLVAASHWRVRGNTISDFAKAGSDRTSYGAFAKGGGSDNRFEQNLVLCEHGLRNIAGARVGISLGGGGTAREYCRDGQCLAEQQGSVIASNLIASCSDDGIYINRAAASKIVHNTLIDTGGIVVRDTESSADIEGNLVDGAIRSRDGGTIRATDNIETAITRLYLGSHPVRALFRNRPSPSPLH